MTHRQSLFQPYFCKVYSLSVFNKKQKYYFNVNDNNDNNNYYY